MIARWFYLLMTAALLAGFSCAHRKAGVGEMATVTSWQYLFDGGTGRGWKSAQGDGFPAGGWVIKDSILVVEAGGGGGDIVTVDQFSSFELSLEFKLTTGANSGIKYFVQSGTSLGLEYQLLDDENHPDARAGVDGNRTLASLYDLIPAENRTVRPVGEWNEARIVVEGDQIEHWLNGQKVVSYQRNTQMFRALLARSKYHDILNFGQHPRGHILLQDHGDKVYFRHIRIKNFKN